MCPGSGVVSPLYSFVRMWTGGATRGLEGAHGVAALAQGVDSRCWPARICPLRLTVV